MANTTQALWIVIIALSVSCVILLSLVIKSSYFSNQNNSTDAYGGYYGKVYPENTPNASDKPGSKDPQAETPDTEQWHDFRLSHHIIPVHYDLLLIPDIHSENFTGEVNITVNVTESVGTVIIHKYKTLDIFSSWVTSEPGGMSVAVDRSFEYVPNEFWVIQMKEELVGGQSYVVHLTFGASLTGSIVGLYKSTYTNKKLNTTSGIVSSKFQPTFARRAFPCFDEPNWKSTFTVTLIHDENVVALSNMPVKISEKLEDGLMKSSFEKSVPMVTYLVCFVIGDYKYLSTSTKSGTEEIWPWTKLIDYLGQLISIHRDWEPEVRRRVALGWQAFGRLNNVWHSKLPLCLKRKFRVYATPDQVENAQYALDLGSQVLSYFEEYFVIPYPLPKQDMVAIPDFVSGAMEHWGLITYRETNLLFNEKESSSVNKQRVATVISHELAHMWFGNLVTMEWWDDLWLNEGFASYVEYKGAAQFLTSDLQSVMVLDSQVNSHPIIQPVHHPDQITEIFDRISYSKGASVLRMLEHFMGPKDFQKGIQMYLTKYEYGNAKTEDLWQKLSLSSTKVNINSLKLQIRSVKKTINVLIFLLLENSIMKSWTKQQGYPVVTVSRDGTNGFSASQQQYYENLVDKNKQSPIWEVPLSYLSAESSTEEMVWLNSSGPKYKIRARCSFYILYLCYLFFVAKFTWEIADSNSWIKFNYKQNGFYIVNYDLSDWLKLQALLEENHEVLSPEDRSSLLYDVFRLASAGHVGYDLALNFTKYLVKETHYVPWRTAYSFFADFLSYLSGSDSYPSLKKYILHLTSPLMTKLGWEDTGSHLDNVIIICMIILKCFLIHISVIFSRLLRSVIIKLSCKSGHRECLDEASKLFKEWMNGKTIHPNLRNRVYEYGTEQSGHSAWEYMWTRYKNENSPQEKTKLLYGLSNTRIPWLLTRQVCCSIHSNSQLPVGNFQSSNSTGNIGRIPSALSTLTEIVNKLYYRFLKLAEDENNVKRQDYFTVLRYVAWNPTGHPIAWMYLRDNWPKLVQRFTLNERYLGSAVKFIVKDFKSEFRLNEAKEFFKKYPEAGSGRRSRKQALEEVESRVKWLKTNEKTVNKWLKAIAKNI
ncbi:Glutamyl aminopeptidase [Nymphon striatum]|nr:Glutamyl aminopeptidase [Nymphon striatum]